MTLWAHDEPDDRACSAAKTLSAAFNDVVDQLKRPQHERFGTAPATDDDEDDDDDFDGGDFVSFHHPPG